jgi:cytochrome c-type biogenesis protein CcmH/NrfG
MKEKDYTQAVEAYKDALRNKPSDEETRYNYALAKKMLKENPPKDDKRIRIRIKRTKTKKIRTRKIKIKIRRQGDDKDKDKKRRREQG